MLASDTATVWVALIGAMPLTITAISTWRTHRQFKNNGGSTAKDQFDRIESKLDRLDTKVVRMDSKVDRLDTRVDELEMRVSP